MSAPNGRGSGRRRMYAAAHVAGDGDGDVDWDATLAFREQLWDLGLGVAEAMDTAQRGAGLEWPLAADLIERTLAAAGRRGADVVCGATTDQLPPEAESGLDEIVAAYAEQCRLIEDAGGDVVVMASRHLAQVATRPEHYARVYGEVLERLRRPAILHWLGPAFDRTLTGYWGSEDLDRATDACLQIIERNRDRVAGIKLSLLDSAREVRMRRRLPDGVLMFTGDDYDFPELIRGDELGHSHALLGAFDPIAPLLPAARGALERGDADEFERILAPALPLARHLFAEPTQYYKTGIVWLAYLNGHQERFTMLGHAESQRSPEHLVEAMRLAEAAGVLVDPRRARERAERVFGAAASIT